MFYGIRRICRDLSIDFYDSRRQCRCRRKLGPMIRYRPSVHQTIKRCQNELRSVFVRDAQTMSATVPAANSYVGLVICDFQLWKSDPSCCSSTPRRPREICGRKSCQKSGTDSAQCPRKFCLRGTSQINFRSS